MILRIACGAILASLVLLGGQGSSFAHPQKAAIATIEPNYRTGVIEIVHRFSQHDAEHAAHLVGATPQSIISSVEVQKKFAEYVTQSFRLSNLKNEEIDLNDIGFEFEGGYIWVYQETSLLEGVEGLIVQYSALQEIWPDQTNTVNVKLDGEVKTLRFTGRTRIQEVYFDEPLTHR